MVLFGCLKERGWRLGVGGYTSTRPHPNPPAPILPPRKPLLTQTQNTTRKYTQKHAPRRLGLAVVQAVLHPQELPLLRGEGAQGGGDGAAEGAVVREGFGVLLRLRVAIDLYM